LAQLRHGLALARHYEVNPGPLPPGVAVKMETAKRAEAKAELDRAKYWPDKNGKGRKVDRWTGRNLGEDAIAADKLADRGFAEFYANHYSRICLYVHGSGLARVAGLTPELFPVLSTIAFQTIGHFAIVAAEMTLRLAGRWDREAERAVQDVKDMRQAAIDGVFANHPARKKVPKPRKRRNPPRAPRP